MQHSHVRCALSLRIAELLVGFLLFHVPIKFLEVFLIHFHVGVGYFPQFEIKSYMTCFILVSIVTTIDGLRNIIQSHLDDSSL